MRTRKNLPRAFALPLIVTLFLLLLFCRQRFLAQSQPRASEQPLVGHDHLSAAASWPPTPDWSWEPNECGTLTSTLPPPQPAVYSGKNPRKIILPGTRRTVQVTTWRSITWDYLQHPYDPKDICPYHPELRNYFEYLRSILGSDPWPVGFAPCSLFRRVSRQQRQCRDAAGRMTDVVISSNLTNYRESDIIYFDYLHFTGHQAPPFYSPQFFPPKWPWQRWVMMHANESLSYYPHIGNPAFLGLFDLRMGRPFDLMDIPVDPFMPKLINVSLTPLISRPQAGRGVAAFIASNCNPKNGRTELVTALMNYLPIDSFGRCQHNKEFDQAILQKHRVKALPDNHFMYNWQAIKQEQLAKYPFYLAFENSECVDYVTEKLWDGLIAGSIPVYLGAPNIDDFLPDPSAVINARDFSNAKELAAYLKMVIEHPELYEKHQSWRKNATWHSGSRLAEMQIWRQDLEMTGDTDEDVDGGIWMGVCKMVNRVHWEDEIGK